jgi:hypothetical protein
MIRTDAKRFRLGYALRCAPACDLHEEVTECVVELLNTAFRTRGIVRLSAAARPCSP